jgi:hypothetical protein
MDTPVWAERVAHGDVDMATENAVLIETAGDADVMWVLLLIVGTSSLLGA